ncbi:phage regulator Rha-like protein [Azotobacter chroococcum]|uniref:Phage regulator Rha-like protein n=2 Tax=Azotobacter chroococcum TaxID=353 RepID=A0A4R1PJ61_9GAMM|nr:phage regulator Rha-like protein [Azotobacter chroococcum]
MTKPVTMSSREIAKLTGKEHKNVLRDIREMLDALEKDGSDLSHVGEDKDARGYTKQFHLDRELTETLVTGYSIPLRHKVIRRIHELEQKVPDHVPAIAADMQDTVSALLLIGEAIKQVPGIKPGIAMACTLGMIEVNTGLDVTEARKALPAKNDPVCDLNATALGKLVGMSGKAANLALAGAGLQLKNDRGDWELTEAGRRWAEAMPFERRGHAGYQILWNRDVLGVLGLDEPGPQVA